MIVPTTCGTASESSLTLQAVQVGVGDNRLFVPEGLSYSKISFHDESDADGCIHILFQRGSTKLPFHTVTIFTMIYSEYSVIQCCASIITKLGILIPSVKQKGHRAWGLTPRA
jgi:hypothetical protein